MKDHTFNARNDEQRARRTKANEPVPDYKVDDSPAMQKKAARQRAKGIAATTDAQPGSIAALADATDLVIRAALPAPRPSNAKHGDDVTAKVTQDMKCALAAREKHRGRAASPRLSRRSSRCDGRSAWRSSGRARTACSRARDSSAGHARPGMVPGASSSVAETPGAGTNRQRARRRQC